MKKIVFVLLLSLSAYILQAQQWNISIEHENEIVPLLDGCCNTNNGTMFVGLWEDSAFAMYVDENGNYNTKIFTEEGRTSKFLTINALDDGNYFVTGISKMEEDDYLWVLVLDDDMNVVAERFYDQEDEYSDSEFYSTRTVVDDDGTIVVCVGVEMPYYIPDIYRTRGVFMRFNTECERLHSVFIAPDAYSSLFYSTNFEPQCLMNAPDNDDILVLGPGEGGCQSVMRFDSYFNLLWHHVMHGQGLPGISGLLGSHYYSDYWLTNDTIQLVGSLNPSDYDAEFLVFGNVSLDDGIMYDALRIDRTKVDTMNYAIQNHSMCTANDTTIYLLSVARVGYFAAPPVMEIYLVSKNKEILGSRFFYDETSYHPLTAIATRDYGLVTVSTSRYAATHIKKFLREDFNPIPCSVSEVPQDRLQALVFPNPTSNLLNIDLSGIDMEGRRVRIRITDSEGRVCLDRIICGSGNLLTIDVSSVPDGTYVFHITEEGRTLVSRKFIKEN